jgi:hypothetical protein
MAFAFGSTLQWEGSTTMAHTVVGDIPWLGVQGEIQRCDWSENALFSYVPGTSSQAKGSFKPITALYSPPYIKPRNFAKRQCEPRWLTPLSSGSEI